MADNPENFVPPDAEALLRRALSILQKASRPVDPGVARKLVNLADVYLIAGAGEAAEDAYRRALQIHETRFMALGEGQPGRGRAMAFLQRRYRQAKGSDDSLDRWALAIATYAIQLTPDDREHLLHGIGILYAGRWQYVAAKTLLLSALAVLQRERGRDDPALLPVLSTLAPVLLRLGDVSAEAEDVRGAHRISFSTSTGFCAACGCSPPP